MQKLPAKSYTGFPELVSGNDLSEGSEEEELLLLIHRSGSQTSKGLTKFTGDSGQGERRPEAGRQDVRVQEDGCFVKSRRLTRENSRTKNRKIQKGTENSKTLADRLGALKS